MSISGGFFEDLEEGLLRGKSETLSFKNEGEASSTVGVTESQIFLEEANLFDGDRINTAIEDVRRIGLMV